MILYIKEGEAVRLQRCAAIGEKYKLAALILID